MKSLRLAEAIVCGWLALGYAVGSVSAQTAAQNPPASAGPVESSLLEDLAVANHILASHGVLDAYGHVSVRHPANPDRFLMSRSLAPALVTTGDILEYDLDGMRSTPRAARASSSVSSMPRSTRRGRT